MKQQHYSKQVEKKSTKSFEAERVEPENDSPPFPSSRVEERGLPSFVGGERGERGIYAEQPAVLFVESRSGGGSRGPLSLELSLYSKV